MIVGVFPLMDYLEYSKVVIPEPWQSLGALYMPLAVILSLTAICTGIVGLCIKNRSRAFALAGLVLGSCSMLAFAGILVMIFAVLQRSAP